MSSEQASRRKVLSAFGSGAVALSGGCLTRARTLTGWQSHDPVQLRIKTLPADDDPYALELARTVGEWFTEAGIETNVLPMDEQELLRQTLLRNEFELFVMRLPARFTDPDALYSLLHSRYTDEPGWKNPFGYANLDVDSALEAQRVADAETRHDLIDGVQWTVARTQPFTLLTVPDDIRAAREDRFSGWDVADLDTSLGYFALEPVGEEDELRVVTTDERATTNLNPLSVEFRRNGTIVGLLYDSLGTVSDGEIVPWLASTWGVSEGEELSMRVQLRGDTRWHDDEPLTADDVVFTYDLIADTALGDGEDEAPVPSPRFSGRSDLVETVTAIDDSTVEFRFGEVAPAVALRAFTVPILPEHVWSDRTGTASLGGISVGPVTEALVTDNIPPVGSGPIRFMRNTPRERLVLERFEDHFTAEEESEVGVSPLAFERLALQVVGSDVTAVELVIQGDADVTGTAVGAGTVPRIGRTDETKLLAERSGRPYVLGYNTRRPYLDNPRFRNTLARLVDGAYLSEQVLAGYGRPAVSPLAGTEWLPDRLAWDDGNPATPFLGSDGEVNGSAARDAFREAGYEYDDGSLVGGST